MRFLANENFPLASVHRLRKAGHDITSVLEIAAGAKDPMVLAHAAREDRVLLTFDRDYGELIFRRSLPPPAGVVFLRFIPETPEEAAIVISALDEIVGLQFEGRYTVVDRQKVRQRPLPNRPS